MPLYYSLCLQIVPPVNHTLSLRRSSEDDLKEYFLFPIELLPVTSAGLLFSDSIVYTTTGFKVGAMNTHLSLSNDGDSFLLFSVNGQNCC